MYQSEFHLEKCSCLIRDRKTLSLLDFVPKHAFFCDVMLSCHYNLLDCFVIVSCGGVSHAVFGLVKQNFNGHVDVIYHVHFDIIFCVIHHC